LDEHPWLYQKLFIGPAQFDAAADRVLVHHIAPLSGFLLEQGWIDRYFFLRYAEGGFHIRYRIRLTSAGETACVQAYLEKAAARFDGVVRTERADYQPETGKYGGPAGIAICERLFDSSSTLALACIERTLRRPDLRLVVAVFGFDVILAASGVRAEAREAVLAGYARYWNSLSWGQQHAPAPELSETLVAALSGQLYTSGGRPGIVAELVGPGLGQWVRDLRFHLAELRALWHNGKLVTHPVHIACNLAHTMNNRLGISPPDEVLIARLLQETGRLQAEASSGEAHGL
jgi:thiopeptide-type bacteriocin biosynthesis protein